jgi:catechol 2,3-dioxygenase-like lactoylglutathione lyase family enzyme
MPDLGWTHVALGVRDLAASVAFYERYARMKVVHAREEPADGQADVGVAWLADEHRRSVLVLVTRPDAAPALTGIAHLGLACASREEVDEWMELARAEGRTVRPPIDSGPPVGYWGFIEDPDGNNLELSFGQEIGPTLGRAGDTEG